MFTDKNDISALNTVYAGEMPTPYINREGYPITLSNLIAELEASTGTDMSSSATKHRIWTAIDRLPAPERDLINMIYFREAVRRSDRELAIELGIDGPELSRKRREILNKLIKATLSRDTSVM